MMCPFSFKPARPPLHHRNKLIWMAKNHLAGIAMSSCLGCRAHNDSGAGSGDAAGLCLPIPPEIDRIGPPAAGAGKIGIRSACVARREVIPIVPRRKQNKRLPKMPPVLHDGQTSKPKPICWRPDAINLRRFGGQSPLTAHPPAKPSLCVETVVAGCASELPNRIDPLH
jgi:hypothetical protein